MADDALADPVAGPIAKLLELGEPSYNREFVWPDYRSFGIGPDHIPALIALATDQSLLDLPDDDDPRGWAPVHAWRALGQLRALQAIRPLMRLFHEIRDNDWVIEEMPDVFAMIGPVAFGELAAYLQDSSYPTYSRLVAATSLMEIALAHPQVRNEAVEILAGELAAYKQNSSGMNGVLIANLVNLDAAEKADLIQRAFAAGKVDRFIAGDWRDIKKRFQKLPAYSLRSSLSSQADSVPPDPGKLHNAGG